MIRESLLFLTNEAPDRRTFCLLPIVGDQTVDRQEHYGLMMERLGNDCSFRLKPLADVKVDGSRSVTDGPVAGCLGVIRREGEDFCCVITKCTMVADLASSPPSPSPSPSPSLSPSPSPPPSGNRSRRIYRIDRVAFHCISSDKYEYVDALSSADPGGRQGVSMNGGSELGDPAELGLLTDPTVELAAYLSSGHFFFSYDHDLTRSVQREELDRAHSWRTCSMTFFWNAFLLDPIREFAEGLGKEQLRFVEHGGLFVVAMQGFVQASTIPYTTTITTTTAAGPSQQPKSRRLNMAVVSRLSCHRAGTRFRARGIDDDGHVANFVESEVILLDGQSLFSYIILRGSVPVFWDQQGLQFAKPTFQITRSAAATQPAFDRHFDRLTRQYGLVHCLDLLGQKPGSAEQLLSAAFQQHAEQYPGHPDSMSLSRFDVNAACRGESLDRVGSIMPLISQDLRIFGYFHDDRLAAGDEQKKIQRGVFRVNCQDCLDRTNVVQGFIARTVVELFVRQHLLSPTVLLDANAVLMCLSELWANSGDALSMIYTGTGALRSGYTRSGRRTLAGLMDDVRKTAQRFYVNNFQDKSRQQAVDILLGKQADQERVPGDNPISKTVLLELTQRIDEYSSVSPIRVLAVTWNCNGARPRDAYDSNCLLELISLPDDDDDDSDSGSTMPELVAVSFQEIVELSATHLVSVDHERRLEWEAFLLSALNGITDYFHYSLLVSNQQVGTSLSLFVRSECIPMIRNVEIASIKTGFGGMTGNKGSVGIRLDYCDSSLCFVGSHFIAGQQSVAERNREYCMVASCMFFSKQKTVEGHHDIVVWMGDLNYRLDMPMEQARDLIAARRFPDLLSHCQLCKARSAEHVFRDYQEADIKFPPTYKYDRHTSQYDTSEKMRTPSYCDRVLVRGPCSSILFYGRAGSIDLSDHRPVKALVELNVRRIDRDALEALQSVLFAKYIDSPPQEAADDSDARTLPPALPPRPLARPALEAVIDTLEQPFVAEERSVPLSELEDDLVSLDEPAVDPGTDIPSPQGSTIHTQLDKLRLSPLDPTSDNPSQVIPPGIVESRKKTIGDDPPASSRSPAKPPKPAMRPVTPGSASSSDID